MRNASTDEWDDNNDDWNGETSVTSATNLIHGKTSNFPIKIRITAYYIVT